MENPVLVFVVAVAVIVLGVLASGFRVAQEYQRGVLFRLGRFSGLRGPGWYWIYPLGIDQAISIDCRVQTVAAEQQETITRDSVTVSVNAVIWYHIHDPARSVIEVREVHTAIYQMALTGLRNVIGKHDLDEVLQEREKINELLLQNVTATAAHWGIAIDRFEMKDVELPEAMQQVMAMQAEAIREKRARIIKAEAELEASEKLALAALKMSSPAALELRRMQMIAEVGMENNSTTVLMIPSDFVTAARSVSEMLQTTKAT